MMIARHSSGACVTYRNANYVLWAEGPSGYHELYRSKNSSLVARVPGDWIIEWDKGEPSHELSMSKMTVTTALEIVENCVTEIKDWTRCGKLVSLKRKLKAFDARQRCWKR